MKIGRKICIILLFEFGVKLIQKGRRVDDDLEGFDEAFVWTSFIIRISVDFASKEKGK